MTDFKRERLADYEKNVLALYEGAGVDTEELLLLTKALSRDRDVFLNEYKMGRVRVVDSWIDRIDGRVKEIKDKEFENIPSLGIF